MWAKLVCLCLVGFGMLVLNDAVLATVPHQGWTFVYWRNGAVTAYPSAAYDFIVLALYIFALIVAIGVLCSMFVDHDTTNEPELDTSPIDREARRLRDAVQRTDAETAFLASAIARARADAEHSEIYEIAEHERAMRDLRRKLK